MNRTKGFTLIELMILIAIIAILLAIASPIVGNYMKATSDVATAPARVISRTAETDNIINNYEWFFDNAAAIESRVSQIKGTRAVLAETTDPSDRSMRLIELQAQQQSCRDLVTKYNANSAKMNRSVFKSKGLPTEFTIAECE